MLSANSHLTDVMSALRLRNVTSSEGGATQSDCSSITGSEPSSDRRLEVRAEECVGVEESLRRLGTLSEQLLRDSVDFDKSHRIRAK